MENKWILTATLRFRPALDPPPLHAKGGYG